MTANEKTLAPIFDMYDVPVELRSEIIERYAEPGRKTAALVAYARTRAGRMMNRECHSALYRQFLSQLTGSKT
jgi:hypothetical protein